MAFVCTVLDDTFRVSIFSRDHDPAAVIVDIGYDDAMPYDWKLFVGLSATAGLDGVEFYFYLARFDSETGGEECFWSGRDVAPYIDKPSRTAILDTLLSVIRDLLDRVCPHRVLCVTHEANPPEEALLKYELVGRVFRECGYDVKCADSYHGKRVWWMERL
jgi:hypothetical protein